MPRYFRVVNLDRFQHYKRRAPPWIKLHSSILENYEFGRLQDASKMHLIAIWLLASRTDNTIPWDNTWVGQRINATTKVNLEELQAAGFIEEIVDASNALADCVQSANSETETETEAEERQRRGEAEKILAPTPEQAQTNGVAPVPEEFLRIPLVKKGEEHIVTEADIAEYTDAYPAVDVRQQLREIRQWNLNNPTNRKTPGGIRRHIGTWLADKQNRASTGRIGGKRGPKTLDQTKQEMEEQWKRLEDIQKDL